MAWTNQNKNTSVFDMQGSDLLLKEDDYRILLEAERGIILEQSEYPRSITWTNQSKN